MPKIVDHDQRREEIAAALTRLVARVGVEGASVRAVAGEAGWSVGAVRHYFATQEELLRFAVAQQLQRLPERLRVVHGTVPAGRGRAEAVVAELLPLDDERLAEARVWLALLGRSLIDPTLDDLRLTAYAGERYLCRAVVCDLLGRPWPEDLQDALDPPHEEEAAKFHAVLDGLTLLGASYPDTRPAAAILRLLAAHLDDLERRLTG